jgi:hypothetical protein
MLTGSHSAETTNVAADKSVVLDFHGSLAFVPQPDGSEELRMRGTAGFTCSGATWAQATLQQAEIASSRAT